MEHKNIKLINDQMSSEIIEAAKELALEKEIRSITVRDILKKLGITNRVFYNRFKNINEVLDIVYTQTSGDFHSLFNSDFDSKEDFFEQVLDLMESLLRKSYETKSGLNHFIFEQDSLTDTNFNWWKKRIIGIIDYAKEKNYIKPIDSDLISYALWCFIRGYNTDALSRNIPLDEALKGFRYSFKIFLDGLKTV